MELETKKSLYDILEAARDIQEYAGGLTFEDFRTNGMAQAAVERKFEIIGEALSRVVRSDPTVLEQVSDYQRIIDFRNVIAHGYDVVDTEIVWEAIQDYLPVLVREVGELLNA